ncbi:prepilin-type N-terminal cleavage/methylation domain-containing protein [Candidatus Uabimicrobium amorphum]|uniref:Prepilin-type N-terminal cleavage/methylation domain-containing protein n=1 Tax=Uabimicrobium amorphum TaxID=2596890 RepID=A0A5S9ILX2_UABAM|nr:prepilin-type N-terminal cleavage/methylation domain-containing protein [Candidatus Uabimicrobium amorphum]BBM83950.1 hypothetical protein UABAM_02305 [Candidatus Uabimicrobium amorphum]
MLRNKTQSGLSLIEVMISVGILAIAATAAIAMYTSGKSMNMMNNDRQTVYKALQEAISQARRNISTSGEPGSQPFVQRSSFTIFGIRGATDGNFFFDDDGEDVGAGNGTQLARVSLESVNSEGTVVNLDDMEMIKITAEARADFRTGGQYLNERLVLMLKQ